MPLIGLFRKLNWNDFRGRPPGGPFAASTASSFTVSPRTFVRTGGFQLNADALTVTVVFNQNTSWRIPAISQWPQQLQDELLDHEQGHYDITALMARDLFIKLMGRKLEVFTTEQEGRTSLQWWIDLYNDNEQKVQRAYDGDTGHSQANVFVPSTNMFTPPHQKGGPQVKWERLIASGFTSLRPSGETAPDGTPYKLELMDILKNANITP